VNEYFTPAIVPADPEANTTDLLLARLAATPDAALFALPTADGGWSDVSVAEFHRQVVALAKGLIAAGIKPGDKIGFMCKTRYEWTLIDFATWFAGAVLVPIYETSAPAQIQYNLDDSGATALIVETADHFAKFDEVRSELPQVTTSGSSVSATSTSWSRTARPSPTTRSRSAAVPPRDPTSPR
jgi:Long-chain acyl-CoA synthetases (AMP-forming)